MPTGREFALALGIALTLGSMDASADRLGDSYYLWLERADIPADTDLARALASVLTEKDRQELRMERARTYVAQADLNQDEQDEAIVHVSGSWYCRLSGCPTFIFTRAESGDWREIGQTPALFDSRVLPVDPREALFDTQRFAERQTRNLPLIYVSDGGLSGWPTLMAGDHLLRWIGHRYTLDPVGSDRMSNRLRIGLFAADPQDAAAIFKTIRAGDKHSILEHKTADDIGILDFDLDRDGKNERLVVFTAFANCGTAGCPAYVLTAEPERRIVGSFQLAPADAPQEGTDRRFRAFATLWPEFIDGWPTIEGHESGLRWLGDRYDYFCIGRYCEESIGSDRP